MSLAGYLAQVSYREHRTWVAWLTRAVPAAPAERRPRDAAEAEAWALQTWMARLGPAQHNRTQS
jgi:hypothetical protein